MEKNQGKKRFERLPEEKEKGPRQKLIVVYRGENPYMMELAKRLREAGFYVDERMISMESHKKFEEVVLREDDDEKIRNTAKEILGEVPEDALIISDITTHYLVESAAPSNEILDAYSFLIKEKFNSLEDVIEYFKPIVDELRSKGKIPVLIQDRLLDHMESEISRLFESLNPNIIDELEEKTREYGLYPYESIDEARNWIWEGGLWKEEWREELAKTVKLEALLSTIIKEKLGIPIISQDELRWYKGKVIGNILQILEKHGLNKDKVVLLVDHHIYILEGENLEKSGFLEVMIAPICPCCIVKRTYAFRLKEKGFKVFPLEPTTISNDAFERLKLAIKEKQK
jgi:hypothetical protein